MRRVKESAERLITMARSLLSTSGRANTLLQSSWNKQSEYERYPDSRDEHGDGIKVTSGIELGPSVPSQSYGKTQGAPHV